MQQLVVTGSGRRAQQRLDSLTILSLEKGLWYVILLLSLVAILGTAALGSNYGRKLAGLVGPVLSLVTASLVVGLITTFDGQLAGPGRVAQVGTSAGSWLALAAMPLLGFACGLIAIGRAVPPVPAPVGVVQADRDPGRHRRSAVRHPGRVLR